MSHYFMEFKQLYLLLLELFHYFIYNINLLDIPVPVGIIGGWRWSIWLFRKTIGFFYRARPATGYMTSTSIVIPVYNENPDVFRLALRSWLANRPTEIIAVIDHSDEQCIQIFQEFQKGLVDYAFWETKLELIITKKPGKRPALVDGILVATGDIVFLVDSDTIWAENVLINSLAPFEDPAVGGVTIRQNVWQPKSVAQRVFDVYLDIRYSDEVRYLTAFGDAITCLSGRTAVYRRTAVAPLLDELMNETFMGQRVISGDDKCLTLLLQSGGWKVCYQENARVYTPGFGAFAGFQKQRLRWARNSWRSDLKALFSRWAWRKPFFIFHLIDRLFQPFTTLIAPIYCLFCVYQQRWFMVGLLISWWFLSRLVKVWPHLQWKFSNIKILPWYIGIGYWFAVVRIYALFTMNQQGWITRWNSSRMALAGPLRLLPGYLATAVTVLLIALFINILHTQTAAKTDPALAIHHAAPSFKTRPHLPKPATSANSRLQGFMNIEEANRPVITDHMDIDETFPLVTLPTEVITETNLISDDHSIGMKFFGNHQIDDMLLNLSYKLISRQNKP
jgi:cellulose synthase/poly-beta-1,6-N-acetylglucosamine synthase-like glycosyltransferase